MLWITVNLERIVSLMSATRRGQYNNWLDSDPTAEDRAAGQVANIVAEFRSALASNPQNDLDPDISKLPQTCIRYADVVALSAVYQMVGVSFTKAEADSMSKAEIFLRLMYTSRLLLTGGGEEEYSGTPSYAPPRGGRPRSINPDLEP